MSSSNYVLILNKFSGIETRYPEKLLFQYNTIPKILKALFLSLNIGLKNSAV